MQHMVSLALLTFLWLKKDSLVFYVLAVTLVYLQGQVEAEIEDLGFERFSIYRPA